MAQKYKEFYLLKKPLYVYIINKVMMVNEPETGDLTIRGLYFVCMVNIGVQISACDEFQNCYRLNAWILNFSKENLNIKFRYLVENT